MDRLLPIMKIFVPIVTLIAVAVMIFGDLIMGRSLDYGHKFQQKQNQENSK